MAGKSNVETGVDGLVSLLKTTGTISIPDAAKKLGADSKTVETWVDFLVEEDKLSLEYKFTTPFISLKEHKEEEKDDFSINIDDFESEIQNEIESDAPVYVKKKAVQKSQGNPLENVYMLLKENKIDEAYTLYTNFCNSVSASNNAPDNISKSLIELNTVFLQIIHKFRENYPSTVAKIDSLMAEARESLARNNIDDAKSVYNDIKKYHDSFPSLLTNEKSSIAERLTMLQKNITQVDKHIQSNIVKEARGRVTNIRLRVQEALKSGSVEDAEGYLTSLNKIYLSLPSNSGIYKLQLHNEILKVQNEIRIAKRLRELYNELKMLGAKVSFPVNFAGSSPNSGSSTSAGPSAGPSENSGSPSSDSNSDKQSSANESDASSVKKKDDIDSKDKDILDSQDNSYNSLSAHGIDIPTGIPREESAKPDGQSSSKPVTQNSGKGAINQSSSQKIENKQSSSHNSQGFSLSGLFHKKNPFSNAPKVKNSKLSEPENPDLVFSDKDEGSIDEVPRVAADFKTNLVDPPNNSGKEVDVYAERQSENPDDPSLQYAVPMVQNSHLQEKFGNEDNIMGQAITAFNGKDYFRARDLLNTVLKSEPENVKAKQMLSILNGILSDNQGNEAYASPKALDAV
ncbi:MAG: hypothetical protein ACOCUR_02745 [Nanoarchaeota archaeon]